MRLLLTLLGLCAVAHSFSIPWNRENRKPSNETGNSCKCGKNEVESQHPSCETPCEPSCSNPTPPACPAVCIKRLCNCAPNYYRNSINKCVELSKCKQPKNCVGMSPAPPGKGDNQNDQGENEDNYDNNDEQGDEGDDGGSCKCKKNEVPSPHPDCETPCEPSCMNPIPPACPAICIKRQCNCAPNFYRNDKNRCVELSKCKKQCPIPEASSPGPIQNTTLPSNVTQAVTEKITKPPNVTESVTEKIHSTTPETMTEKITAESVTEKITTESPTEMMSTEKATEEATTPEKTTETATEEVTSPSTMRECSPVTEEISTKKHRSTTKYPRHP